MIYEDIFSDLNMLYIQHKFGDPDGTGLRSGVLRAVAGGGPG